MEDRVPTYPGRVTLTPVEGQPNTYDLVRADEPTQEGTALNKGNLLSDEACQLLQLSATAVPDDAFLKLGLLLRFQNGLGNEYIWLKEGSTIELSGSFNFVLANAETVSLQCSNTLIISETDPTDFTLLDPTTVWFSAVSGPPLRYQYVKFSGTIYDCSSGYIEYSSGITGFTIRAVGWRRVISALRESRYVNAPEQDAYPPVVSDGYSYTPMGRIGSKLRMETGEYTGTGTSGTSNPNSLVLSEMEGLLFVFSYNANGTSSSTSSRYGIFSLEANFGASVLASRNTSSSGGVYHLVCAMNGNTLKWYPVAGSEASIQLNISGQKYIWVHIF